MNSIKCNNNIIRNVLKCIWDTLGHNYMGYRDIEVYLDENESVEYSYIPEILLRELYNDYININHIDLKNIDSIFFKGCNYLKCILNGDDTEVIDELKKIDEMTFEKELESLLNKYSIDNDCNTPDFILAKYIVNVLEPLKQMINTRADYHGHTECNHTLGILAKKH